MADSQFIQDGFSRHPSTGQNGFQRVNWFSVCYWAAACVQVVGSFNIFGTVGGSVLHALAGALCLELLILALNAYGAMQTGKWMACICSLSLALIAASAMFQAADLLSHPADQNLASRLGAGYYGLLRSTVPVMPSVAMAAITLIKFVDARRSKSPATVAPLPQGEVFDPVALSQTLRDEWRAEIAQLQRPPSLQAVQVNVQTPVQAAVQAPASVQVQEVAVQAAMQTEVQNMQAQPLQLASPDEALHLAIAELQGRPLIEALPKLTARGFSKTAVAAAIGKQPYQLAPSRISKTEVLQGGQ